MKKKILLTLFIIAIFVSVSNMNTNISYATRVGVSLPTFDIMVNGVKVDNRYRKYPFLVYKGVTYFPLTYHDCQFMGIEYGLLNNKVLLISTAETEGGYDEYKQKFPNSKFYIINVPKSKFAFNDLEFAFDNKLENTGIIKNPVLRFRDIYYIPVSELSQIWNWEYLFDAQTGLQINTQDSTIFYGKYTYDIRNTFKLGNDTVKFKIKYNRFMSSYKNNLYVSINSAPYKKLGNPNYIYGVVGKNEGNSVMNIKSDYFMELKEDYLYINAIDTQKKGESKIYKINIKSETTLPAK